MEYITDVSDWLSSLKLLLINTWARIELTWLVWSTCSRLVVESWWIRGQYKYTAILRVHERQYMELTLFASVYVPGYFIIRIRFNRSGRKFSHRGTTIIKSCTSCNICTISSSQYLYGKTLGYSWSHHYPGSFLVDDGYNIQKSVLYPKFTDINECCKLKAKTPESHGGVSYGYGI